MFNRNYTFVNSRLILKLYSSIFLNYTFNRTLRLIEITEYLSTIIDVENELHHNVYTNQFLSLPLYIMNEIFILLLYLTFIIRRVNGNDSKQLRMSDFKSKCSKLKSRVSSRRIGGPVISSMQFALTLSILDSKRHFFRKLMLFL